MENNVPIFRFNFSEEFNKELGYFAKLHKHEDRTEFKENWKEWIDENDSLINEERKRLFKLGYDGNIEDKMYKSVRYYFRKKPLKHEPIQRCKRVVVSKVLLRYIDEHIANNNFNENYTPQNAYEDFCEQHFELINSEIQELNMNSNELVQNKIKKTYKNRFYVIIRQNKKNKMKNGIKNKMENETKNEIIEEFNED